MAMRIHLDRELDRLRRQILTVSAHVEGNVYKAVKAVEKHDVQLASRVVEIDRLIDQMEVDVEEECLKILTLYQPVAADLCFLIAVLQMNNDLERIGDLAVNIAPEAAELASLPPVQIQFDLAGMAGNTQEMLRQGLDAVVKQDSGLARSVCAADDEIDAAYSDATLKVKAAIQQQPDQVDQLTRYWAVTRHIERIADLATNITEDAIYIADGEIVRHRVGVQSAAEKSEASA
jgi:phosphate transport system protein